MNELLTEWEVDIWRRFQMGESAQEIARNLLSQKDGLKGMGDVGRGTVLKIVLVVESQMATSERFFRIEDDHEGCPIVIPIENVQPPSDLDALEIWLS